MDVLLHDGSKIKKSLILKTLPSTPALHKQIEESGIFKTEVLVYKKVLSKMEKFLNNLNDKSEPLWVRALDVREFDQLLLEDAVGDLGYKTANRWKGWDLDHSKLTMKALAKFHALAAVVNEEHHYGEHFKQTVVERNFDELKDFFEVIYNNFAKVIEEKWGPEWTDAAHKVREVAPHVKERLKKLYVERDNILNTLILGHQTLEIFTLNMLFLILIVLKNL
uniref:Juvenile hormone-inducible protein n=1 Tax=Triatoma infestans TaxID=30076 RepID=A0A170ZT34_TRIIF